MINWRCISECWSINIVAHSCKNDRGLIIHFLTPMIKNVLKSVRSKKADGHETHLYHTLNLTVEHSVNRFSWMQITILKKLLPMLLFLHAKSKKVLIVLIVSYLTESKPRYVQFSCLEKRNIVCFYGCIKDCIDSLMD